MNHKATDWEQGLEHAALTDVGLRRPNNQDSLAVVLASDREDFQHKGHLFVVADGMGAHAAGKLASQMAVDTLSPAYRKLSDRSPPDSLLEAMREANAQIYRRGQSSDDCRGMGTTLSALVLLPQGALVAHVGDSRVYRLRANRWEQLTFDHSLLWEVCEAEGVPPAEAPDYIPKHIVTRSVGPLPEVEVDLEGLFPLDVGDTFLLCSDGLSGPVADRELGTILACLPLNEAVRMLVDLAILRGGRDNVTAVVIRVTGPQSVGRSDPNSGVADSRTDTQTWLEHQSHKGRLGKGPYTTLDCTPNGRFVAQLADIVDDLRNVAQSHHWDVDWTQLDAFGDRAAAAVQAADHAQAIREYCRAVRLVFGRLRDQRSRKAPGDDSPRAQESGG